MFFKNNFCFLTAKVKTFPMRCYRTQSLFGEIMFILDVGQFVTVTLPVV